MRKIVLILVITQLFYSCEKDILNPQNNILIQENLFDLHSFGTIKTQLNFSSSKDTLPYSFASYEYDKNWNLKKKLISEYPNPVLSSDIYEYSDKELLLSRKHYSIEGMVSPDRTEADLTLISESKYSYAGKKIIEERFIKDILSDSIIYSFSNNLLESKYVYNEINKMVWSIIYEYDSNGNKIKMTENPEGTYTLYSYDGSDIKKTTNYDHNGVLLVELNYSYTESGDNKIVGGHYKGPYGEFISDKTTYQGGNVIEYIRYHPTKPGEWVCQRFVYY
jgi:hypothetical protein